MQNVAGITAEVAPLTTLSLLQVLGANGDSNAAIRALTWVLNNRGAAPKIVAVNLSFELMGPNSSPAPVYTNTCPGNPLNTLLSALISVNVVPVIAAGNGGHPNAVSAPACTPGVVVVGAVTDSPVGAQSYAACSDGPLAADKIPCLSNGGPLVTILAPGVQIYDSFGDGQTGTSQAAPHVAGAVAVLRGDGAYPNETMAQTIARLTSTGKPIVDQRTNITKPRLQLDAALKPIVASVTVIPNAVGLTPGGSVSLTTSIKDSYGNDISTTITPTWTSSDPNVATVSAAGVVRTLKAGVATVTATTSAVSGTSLITVRMITIGPPNCRVNPRLCA